MAVLPTRRLLCLTLAAAAPLAAATLWPPLLGIAVLYAAGVVLSAVIDVRRAPAARDLAVARQHDARLSLGEPNPIVVHVRWTGPDRAGRPLRLQVRDEAPPEIPVDRLVLDGPLSPGSVWSGRYALTPARRGVYGFGRTLLRVEGPLGLVVRQHAYATAERVPVYPSLRALRRYDLLARHGRLHEGGLHRSRRAGRGTEIERLRDYQPDDDPRQINWKATARRHQPITVEYETERSQTLVLALDAGRLSGAPVGALRKLDHAVNAALTMAHVALVMGDRVGLLLYTDRVEAYLPPDRGRRQLHRLLERLATVEPQPVEADPGSALGYLARRQTRRALIVVFTDVADANDADALVPPLGLLGRRHLPLCVAVGDPEIARLAATTPAGMRAAYERVVARRLLDERRALLARLERRGVLTLDVPAEELTAGVVDRYLEIKARARL